MLPPTPDKLGLAHHEIGPESPHSQWNTQAQSYIHTAVEFGAKVGTSSESAGEPAVDGVGVERDLEAREKQRGPFMPREDK